MYQQDLIDQFHKRLQSERKAKYNQHGNDAFESTTAEARWADDRLQEWIDEENRKRIERGQAPLDDKQQGYVASQVRDRVFGLGEIDKFLRDQNVADIHVMAPDHCMLRLKNGEWRNAGRVAADNDELLRLIQTAAARHGGNIERRFDSLNPELNMQLKDGSRLFALRDVVDSPQLVIRKHDHSLGSLPDLVNVGMMSPATAHFLQKAVQARLNLILIGATSSGKSQRLTDYVPTPTGRTRVGNLTAGDEVLGSDGRPIKLLGLSPVTDETVWTVTFEDGRTVDVSGDHLWEVSSAYDRSQHNPSKPAEREGRQEQQDTEIGRLRARATELAPDLYATIPQIAEWADVTLNSLYRVIPESLGVEHEANGAAGGPQPNELDADAFWEFLADRAPFSLGDIQMTADLLTATRPQEGEWLSARQITQRLTGSDEQSARTSVDRLVRQSGVARRPGTRAAQTWTVYPAREAIHRYADDLDRRRTPDAQTVTVLSTTELAEQMTAHNGRNNWAVEKLPSLDLPAADLPADPYLLGVWLGDGATDSGRIYVGDDDVEATLPLIRQVWPTATAAQDKLPDSTVWTVRCGRPRPDACVRGHDRTDTGGTCPTCETMRWNDRDAYDGPRSNLSLRHHLSDLGMLGDKHIPTEYLRASHDQRVALLAGLMDTDGSIDTNGCCELTLSDDRLAADALDLIRSLGVKASVTTAEAGYRNDDGEWVEGKDRRRIHFTTDLPVFRLPRKAERLPTEPATAHRSLSIVSVEKTDEVVPMRCLYVDAPDHLYLTNDYVPTHNTTLLRAMCAEMPPHESKVTIEEAREIGLARDRKRHPLVRELETRPPDMQGNGAVTAQQLVRMSLRMDPDRVIVGEVRGAEALQMLTAMSQGQKGSMCTMHGDSAVSCFPRLQLYVKQGDVNIDDEDVARLTASAVDFVVYATKLAMGDGTYRRVINEIVETRGSQGTRVASNEICRFDPKWNRQVAVTKPSDDVMGRLIEAGFNYDWWAANSVAGPIKQGQQARSVFDQQKAG